MNNLMTFESPGPESTPGIPGRGATGTAPPAALPTTPQARWVAPKTLRFSQRSAGGRGRAAVLRESMRTKGWTGPPVDVVETPQGLVTIDNTRVALARELEIPQIPVTVHLPTEALPEAMLGRFGSATTWGEALAHRTASQIPTLPPEGTLERPRMS